MYNKSSKIIPQDLLGLQTVQRKCAIYLSADLLILHSLRSGCQSVATWGKKNLPKKQRNCTCNPIQDIKLGINQCSVIPYRLNLNVASNLNSMKDQQTKLRTHKHGRFVRLQASNLVAWFTWLQPLFLLRINLRQGRRPHPILVVVIYVFTIAWLRRWRQAGYDCPGAASAAPANITSPARRWISWNLCGTREGFLKKKMDDDHLVSS
jgi:hypothetical protein